jgi:nitrous oxide reductase
MNSRLALVCTVAATLSFLTIGFYTTSNQMIAFGQDNATAPKNETSSMAMMNANMSSGDKIPSLSTVRVKEFYIFTSEIEGVDEGKLKVAGDVFSVNTLVANKGDKVTVHFYNVDPVKEERHSFTVGDPYAVNIDLGFAESGNATFTADNVGVFPFYCKYHPPVMEGQFVILP